MSAQGDPPAPGALAPGELAPGKLDSDGRTADDRDLPTRTDPMIAQLSTIIGGPVGAHAVIGRQRFLTPLRVFFLLAVIAMSFGWAGKAACLQQIPGEDGAMTLDWRGGRQYVSMCYADAIPLYGGERLSDGEFPYKSEWTDGTVGADGELVVRHMEYPVLTGLYQYGAMTIAKAWKQGADDGYLPGALEVVLYFTVIAIGLALAWLITVWASASLTGRRKWDAALVAASPLVLVHIFTNFDALATAFAMTGLLAWARKRPVLAGVLLGLGAATKMYPMLLLGPLLIVCWRAGKMRDFWRTTAAAAVTWAAVNLPIAIMFPKGWREFYRLSEVRAMNPESIYNVIASFTGWQGFDGPLGPGQAPSNLNMVATGLFVAACVGIAVIGLTSPRRPRVAQLCFLVVAAFLLTNKVWSPQFSLWLVPLAVLALPHTRVLLAWMTIDALTWAPLMYYFHGVANKGLPEQWFTASIVVRDLAVLGLCALIIRQIYRPAEDLVRAPGPDGVAPDDPVGGVVDGAPDKYFLARANREVLSDSQPTPPRSSPDADPA